MQEIRATTEALESLRLYVMSRTPAPGTQDSSSSIPELPIVARAVHAPRSSIEGRRDDLGAEPAQHEGDMALVTDENQAIQRDTGDHDQDQSAGDENEDMSKPCHVDLDQSRESPFVDVVPPKLLIEVREG